MRSGGSTEGRGITNEGRVSVGFVSGGIGGDSVGS
jgi:hypothetical protein